MGDVVAYLGRHAFPGAESNAFGDDRVLTIDAEIAPAAFVQLAPVIVLRSLRIAERIEKHLCINNRGFELRDIFLIGYLGDKAISARELAVIRLKGLAGYR